MDEDLYHATPQTKGKAVHESIDNRTASKRKNELLALPVFSDELGIMGKIDIFRQSEHILIERKFQLKQIFQGQIYQLWAQYFCMIEMGYDVKKLAFHEISTNKTTPIVVPSDEDKNELRNFIAQFKKFNPDNTISINPNKCIHCIYCSLCDKTDTENVYT